MVAKVRFCVLDLTDDLATPWIPIFPHFTRRLCYLVSLIPICLTILILTTMVIRKCCVPNCGKMHPVAEPNRFRTWIYAIGGVILGIENKEIHKKFRVCHNHFEAKYYTASKRLSANAVPTLHLTGFSATRKPLSDITNENLTDDLQQQPSTSKEFFETEQPSTSRDFDSRTGGIFEKDKNAIQHSQTSNMRGSTSRVKKPFGKVFSPEAISMTRQIRKLQNAKDKYATKLKKALKLSENSTFQKAIKNFTTTAIIFTMLQFREINKNKMGRRFTKKEKVMALSLYKQGPKAYRWLRNIFVLPAPVTLSRLISGANLRAGLNDNLFMQLQNRAKKMSETDKLCILLFDEVALAPHLDYNKKRDEIIGFVNDGKHTEKKIADHALVFMIRGIVRNYKQPISYTFCTGSTKKISLALQIKEIIKKLKSVGFHVLATVCDQGASNKSAINYLIKETRENYVKLHKELKHNIFEVDGEEVVPLYDPPHLIKGIRNNLLKKDLVCQIDESMKTAKWEHIMQLYANNPAYKGIRMLPKLTEQHVVPSKISKMKVKCATQVFSKSVGTTMGFLAENKILDASCTETADVILFFDSLFDSVNGGYVNQQRRSGKPLLGALTPTSCHKETWTKSKSVLKSMKFVNATGNECVVPSITNWLWTIENLDYLKNKLFQKYHVRSIWLRHFNQDPLENFFGCIRSHGIRNTNPTCAAFEVAFAALLINNLNSVHSLGSNCEKDNCHTFHSLRKLFFNKSSIGHGTTEINFEHVINDNIILGIEMKKDNPRIMAGLEYVTGYVLRQSSKIIKNCADCKSCLYDENKASTYIKLKDYSKTKGYLTYPANKLVEYFSSIQDVVTYILKADSSLKNIKHYLKTIIAVHCQCDFIKCSKHREELKNIIQDTSCNFFINNWCRDTNKILKGLRQDIDEDEVQKMAYDYYIKRKK